MRVVKVSGAYKVVDERGVHATYTFSTISKPSETMAKLQAHGFVQGYNYGHR